MLACRVARRKIWWHSTSANLRQLGKLCAEDRTVCVVFSHTNIYCGSSVRLGVNSCVSAAGLWTVGEKEGRRRISKRLAPN